MARLQIHAPSNSPSLPLTTSTFRTNPSAFLLHNLSFPKRCVLSSMSSNTTTSSSALRAAADLQFDADTSSEVAFTAPYGGWSEFAEKVSGEWDGYGADFTVEGKPLELPEYVVPQAYKEWEVKVFDWQTQCPTLAKGDGDASMFYKLIKLLPTVGCEADAATRYTIDERNVGGEGNDAVAFGYLKSGSYVAVWKGEEKKDGFKVIEVEHCLVDPRNKEIRVRVVQVVSFYDNMKFVLRGIKVFCEQWYGPFRNGDQLGGCSIRDSSFAASAALKSSLVNGVWRSSNASANFQNPDNKYIQELTTEIQHEIVRDEKDLIFLPRQLWCSLKETGHGGTCCEVGWLLDQGRAITSRCLFTSDSKLKEVFLATETVASEV